MRKSTLISLLMALVLLGCLAIWRYMPRTLSYDECSPVYRHFADMQMEGVRVTYIKDKLVGDSVRVPVTLLEAGLGAARQHLRLFQAYQRSAEQPRSPR